MEATCLSRGEVEFGEGGMEDPFELLELDLAGLWADVEAQEVEDALEALVGAAEVAAVPLADLGEGHHGLVPGVEVDVAVGLRGRWEHRRAGLGRGWSG